ncbi:MAG: DUF2142 domain-containing protein [Schwartzia sp.]|nr:DUF2142 domain-containing protein [Schwartzia sp. (in: firmicutes)]
MIFAKHRIERIENKFIAIYFLMGIICLIALPIYSVMDDPLHYLRAYEISMGKFIPVVHVDENGTKLVGDYLHRNALYFRSDVHSKSLDLGPMKSIGDHFNFYADPAQLTWADYPSNRKQTVDYGSEQFFLFQTTALYAPVSYLPQAAGIAVARNFSHRSMKLAYAGRFMNWLMTGFCFYWALRIIPRHKLLMLAIILIPINVQQCNSLGTDGQLLAYSLLFLAFIMRARESRTISKSSLAIIGALAIAISLTKIVYLPFVLFVLLLPRECFSSKRRYFAYIFSVIFCAAAANLSWYLFARGLMAAQHMAWASPSEQMAWMIAHPLEFARITVNSFVELFKPLMQGMFGMTLGWGHIHINKWLIYGYAFALGCIFLCSAEDENGSSFFTRAFLIFIPFLIFSLICAAEYVAWTPLNAPIIQGMQGKYFLPFLLPIMLAIMPKMPSWPISRAWINQGLLWAIIIIDIAVYAQAASQMLG